MATVQSLTAAKIEELMAGWEGVEFSQEQINSLVSQVWTSQATLDALMEDLQNITLPQLEVILQENNISLSDLVDNVLPGLQSDLDAANAQIENLQTVEIPAIQASLINEIEGSAVRPKVFVQPDEPPAYDDLEERDLVVGDTWFDSDDENKQYFWDGAQWTRLVTDVADFSLTVRKLISSTHMIY